MVRSIGPDQTNPPRDGWLKTTFDHAPIGLAVATVDGQCLRINDTCCQLLGYTRDELLHFSLNDLTHPEDAPKELVLIRRVLAGDTHRYRLKKRFMDKRGTYRPMLVSATLARGSSGAPDVFVYVLETPENTAESGQDAGRLAITILDQLPDVGVIRTDVNGTITGWNKGAEQILGYRRQEVVGKNRRILYRDQDSWTDMPHAHLRAATEQGHHSVDDFRVARDGSHRWLRNAITAYAPDGKVRGFIEVLSTADGAREAIDTAPAIEQLRRELEQERQAHSGALDERELLERRLEAGERELLTLATALRQERARRSEAEALVDRMRQDHVATEGAPAVEVPVAVPTLELPLERVEWTTLDGSPRDLLIDAAANHRTGAMILADTHWHKALFFDNGRLTCIASDDRSDFLGERLVLKGAISEVQRNKALELSEATDLAFGRCLVILGFMTDDAVREAIRVKIEDDIEDLCSWKHCSWSFADREPPHRKLLQLSIDVSQLRAVRMTTPVQSPSVDPAPVAVPSEPIAVLPATSAVKERKAVAPKRKTPRRPKVTNRYIATRGGSRFHEVDCPTIGHLSGNQRLALPNRRAAKVRGLEPCRTCLRK